MLPVSHQLRNELRKLKKILIRSMTFTSHKKSEMHEERQIYDPETSDPHIHVARAGSPGHANPRRTAFPRPAGCAAERLVIRSLELRFTGAAA